MTGKNKKKKLKRAAAGDIRQMANQFVGISRSINELNNNYNALAEEMRLMTTHGLTLIDEVAPYPGLSDEWQQRYISGEFNPR